MPLAHIMFSDCGKVVCYGLVGAVTVNFLNIGIPKIFVVITLKFELGGYTIQ